MLWSIIVLFTCISLALLVCQIEAQYGYQMMAQPVMMAPPAVMVPQMAPAPMAYGGMQQHGHGYGGLAGGSATGGIQKGPWSECSKTCGADSYRTRTYTPCDSSRSSCSEKEGCTVPECGTTKLFKEGDKIKVPCHASAMKEGYRAQWFIYEKNQNNWKFVTLESDRKFMDEHKNLVITSAAVRDKGTYRCNLLSREGSRVAESIWHFTVKSNVDKEGAGVGSAAVVFIIIVVIACICVVKCRKPPDADGSNKASGGEDGYDLGGDFDFGY